jgi:hypothetical protein
VVSFNLAVKLKAKVCSVNQDKSLSDMQTLIKGRIQSVCKQSLCLYFGIQNIELYSTTIYIFMLLQYNKLSRYNNQALQEDKMK